MIRRSADVAGGSKQDLCRRKGALCGKQALTYELMEVADIARNGRLRGIGPHHMSAGRGAADFGMKTRRRCPVFVVLQQVDPAGQKSHKQREAADAGTV